MPSTLPPGFAVRLPLYLLDEEARETLRNCYPIVAPQIEPALEQLLFTTLQLPHISEIIKNHRDAIKALEVAHFQTLLSGHLDHAYADSCRRTVEQEARMGLDGRMRSSTGNFVLRAAMEGLARKHRFSGTRLARKAKVISQVIAFDVANAMTLHREAGEHRAEMRRNAIDMAIAEFDQTIGEVIDAIKETSSSLTSTSATMQQVAEDTVRRMSAASIASGETSQSVDATVSATDPKRAPRPYPEGDDQLRRPQRAG